MLSRFQYLFNPAVDIINYPWGDSSPFPRSRHAPLLIEEACAEVFGRAVRQWKTATVPTTVRNVVTNDIRNRDEIIQALTALGTQTATSQWSGARSLTLGGDHSQGFATVKATLLVQTTQALLDGKIDIKNAPAAKRALLSLADRGMWTDVASYIDSLVEGGNIKQDQLRNFTSKVGVIWIDAHGDWNNVDTTTSNNFHGMSLGAACGQPAGGIQNLFGRYIHADPLEVHVMCTRDLDTPEEAVMYRHGVAFERYSMQDVKRPGIRAHGSKHGVRLQKAINDLMARNPDRKFIVSVDVDHMHGAEVPSTGTPMGLKVPDVVKYLSGGSAKRAQSIIRLNRVNESPAGVTSDDTRAALQGIMHHKQVLAADLTEASIGIGDIGRAVSDKLTTLNTATGVLVAMLGMQPAVHRAAVERLAPLHPRIERLLRQEGDDAGRPGAPAEIHAAPA